MAASVVNELYEDGTISFAESKSLWDIRSVAEKMDVKINY
jgi:hypothetical protein